MINVDTLAVMLRVLGRAAPGPSITAPPPTLRVLPVAPVVDDKALQSDDASEAARQETTRGATDEPSTSLPAAPRPLGLPRAMDATSPTGAQYGRAAEIALSSAGALLLEALNLPDENVLTTSRAGATVGRATERSGPVVRNTAPLIAGSPSNSAALAQAIEKSIVRSGLFYESHLARWAANDFARAELEREPQTAWQAQVAGAEPVHVPAGAVLMTEQAPVLIRQQLEAHEAHRLMVQGLLWPGQQGVLEFEESGHTREHGTAYSPYGSEPVWSARFDMDLPSLGRVQALVSVRDGRLDCRLHVAGGQADARLTNARADLEHALRARDLALAQCMIDHD